MNWQKQKPKNIGTVLNEKYKALYTDLQNSLDGYPNKHSDENILSSFKNCHEAGLMEEGSINQMGYDYLMGQKKPLVAEVVFKSNTILFPNSANVYDSYGEALAENGKLESSVINYKKAVELAKENDNPNLELFEKNLMKIKTKMEKRP